MLSKNTIKYLRSLRLKKFRQKYNKFLVEGDKIAREVIASPTFEIENIYALNDWIKTNEPALKFHLNKTIAVSPSELERLSGLKTPNQVIILARMRKFAPDVTRHFEDLALYLDNIQDPGNMGTIIRTADWFGIKTIFCSKTCADYYNSKVLQASMGSFLRVEVIYMGFETLMHLIPATPVYGTVLEGSSLFDLQPGKHGLIVIGNESKGISADILSRLDHKITIPALGAAESLNAAVACGIVCAMFRKSTYETSS